MKPSTSRRTSHCFKPHFSHPHPLTQLKQEQTRPNFNLHLIDYVHNTVSYTKEILISHNLRSIVNHKFNNITPQSASHITNLQSINDILTMTDKNMGWASVPISWFSFCDISLTSQLTNALIALTFQIELQTPTHYSTNLNDVLLLFLAVTTNVNLTQRHKTNYTYPT